VVVGEKNTLRTRKRKRFIHLCLKGPGGARCLGCRRERGHGSAGNFLKGKRGGARKKYRGGRGFFITIPLKKERGESKLRVLATGGARTSTRGAKLRRCLDRDEENEGKLEKNSRVKRKGMEKSSLIHLSQKEEKRGDEGGVKGFSPLRFWHRA